MKKPARDKRIDLFRIFPPPEIVPFGVPCACLIPCLAELGVRPKFLDGLLKSKVYAVIARPQALPFLGPVRFESILQAGGAPEKERATGLSSKQSKATSNRLSLTRFRGAGSMPKNSDALKCEWAYSKPNQGRSAWRD